MLGLGGINDIDFKVRGVQVGPWQLTRQNDEIEPLFRTKRIQENSHRERRLLLVHNLI